MTKKIIISGGHASPALAVIDELQINKPEYKIYFVGRKFNNSQDSELSFEYKEIKLRKIPFYNLNTGRLMRSISFDTLQNLFLAVRGFIHSWQIINKIRPHTILSFGGYLALPVTIMGWLYGVKIYTHEQTIHPGITNRIISVFAKNIFISYPQSVSFFPKSKTILTGNPIRHFLLQKSSRNKYKSILDTIYITGGSLGSHSLNVHIENILQELLKKYFVIHQTGNVSEYDDFKRLTKLKEGLNEKERLRYKLISHVDSREIADVYATSDIVISRSGANTVSELIALRIPAVLVPLPWSANDEQKKHAELLENAGVAEVFDQEKSSEILLKLIQKVMIERGSYEKNYSKLENDSSPKAAAAIIETVFKK